MKRVFMVHGWGGAPDKDLFPWAAVELTKRGYEVHAPQMPETDEPQIDAWVRTLADEVKVSDSETYFFAHSIGCQTVLRYLEKVSAPVGGAVFIAPWLTVKGLEPEEELIASPWVKTPLNLDKVKEVLPKLSIIFSDNDPFVPYEENKQAFSVLNPRVMTLHSAGHITGEDGFDTLPEALTEF